MAGKVTITYRVSKGLIVCFDYFYWYLQKHAKVGGERENVDTKRCLGRVIYPEGCGERLEVLGSVRRQSSVLLLGRS